MTNERTIEKARTDVEVKPSLLLSVTPAVCMFVTDEEFVQFQREMFEGLTLSKSIAGEVLR